MAGRYQPPPLPPRRELDPDETVRTHVDRVYVQISEDIRALSSRFDSQFATFSANVEARISEKDRTLRERLEARTADSRREHEQHAADDNRRFSSIESSLKDVTDKLDDLRIASANQTGKIVGWTTAASVAGTFVLWIVEHYIIPHQ